MKGAAHTQSPFEGVSSPNGETGELFGGGTDNPVPVQGPGVPLVTNQGHGPVTGVSGSGSAAHANSEGYAGFPDPTVNQVETLLPGNGRSPGGP